MRTPVFVIASLLLLESDLDRDFLHGRPRPDILHDTMEPDRRNPDDPVEAEEYGALLLRKGTRPWA